MCEPVTITAAAAALAVAGSATSAYGAYQQGKAARAAANYEASVSEQNAVRAEQRIAGARFQGGYQVDQIRTNAAENVGAGRAGYAAGNVDLSVGTPRFWELDAAKSTATDVAMTKYNTEQEVKGLQTEAWNARSQAALTRYSGKNAYRAGLISAGSSLLSGASQVAGTWSSYRMNQNLIDAKKG